MKASLWATLVLGALSLAACGRQDVYKTEISMKEVMGDVVDPAAQAFWARSGDIITDVVVSRVPKPDDDENWTIAENSGTQLAEAANLLLLPGRRRDNGDWVKFAQALHKAGVDANEAAAERDGKKMFDVGGQVYQICTNCHSKYLLPYLDPKTGEPLKGSPLDPNANKR